MLNQELYETITPQMVKDFHDYVLATYNYNIALIYWVDEQRYQLIDRSTPEFQNNRVRTLLLSGGVLFGGSGLPGFFDEDMTFEYAAEKLNKIDPLESSYSWEEEQQRQSKLEAVNYDLWKYLDIE